MNLERYDYRRESTYKEYLFFSNGPNGRILKVVRFFLVSTRPAHVYILSLGDWDNEYNEPDYWSVTNNKDTEKVLATVAAIVLDFTNIFRTALIQVEGNNPARTRLYQRTINKNLYEIEKIFQVLGSIGYELEEVQKNTCYDSFLFARKEYVILKEEETDIYMTSSTKKKTEKKRVYNDTVTYSPCLVSEDHPFIVEKIERSRKTLASITNLEEILKKHNLI